MPQQVINGVGRFGVRTNTTTTTTSSPDFITNGLIQNLDASKVSSYPGTGTLWTDITNNNRNGLLVNGVTYDSSNGGLMTFDGSNDYVSVTNFMGTLNTFTISHWVNLSFDQTGRTIFSNFNPSGNGWVTGISDSTPNRLKFYLGGGNTLESSSNLVSNTWYYVVVTYNNGNPKIYINGALNNTTSTSINFTGNYVYTNDIGRLGNGGQTFAGKIGSVQVYNRALSDAEVLQNYNNTKSRFGTNTTTTTTTAAPTTTTTTTAVSGSLFADTRGIYSLRLVNTSYTGSAIRVRRSSDNTEQNIGFSSNQLDTSALASFVGSSTGYVVKWFDQSGNAYDISQSNTVKQPRIVNNGTLYTLGGKPSVYFDNTVNTNVLSTQLVSGLYNTPSLTAFAVGSKSTGGNYKTTYSRMLSFNKSGLNDYDNANSIILYLGSSMAYTYSANMNLSQSFSMDTKTLFVSTRGNNSLGLAINGGTLVTSSAPGLTTMNSEYFRIGNDVNEIDSGLIGHVQEVILYNSDKTSIIGNIKSNINTYYSIY